jgi:hypothetical protein
MELKAPEFCSGCIAIKICDGFKIIRDGGACAFFYSEINKLIENQKYILALSVVDEWRYSAVRAQTEVSFPGYCEAKIKGQHNA